MSSHLGNLNGTPFWLEARNGLFVHSSNWDTVVQRLPELIRADLVSLQSDDQLLNCGMTGTGQVGATQVEVAPDPGVFGGCIGNDTHLTLGNVYLQWLFKYYILERIHYHYPETPSARWSPNLLTVAFSCLHDMTYLAALLWLFEDSSLPKSISKANLPQTQVLVRERVEKLTGTLYSKCAEYGESFRRHGVQGTVPRLWDKIARYTSLSALNRNAKYEPKEDSCKDLLGYCLIAWSLVLEANQRESNEESSEEVASQESR